MFTFILTALGILKENPPVVTQDLHRATNGYLMYCRLTH
ncbi:hypothetical protein BH09BAC1_BH09BAC1_09050 [soil metagenome]